MRVGSRIHSKTVEPYSLGQWRHEFRNRYNKEGLDGLDRKITRLRFQGMEALEKLKDEIDSLGELVKIGLDPF